MKQSEYLALLAKLYAVPAQLPIIPFQKMQHDVPTVPGVSLQYEAENTYGKAPAAGEAHPLYGSAPMYVFKYVPYEFKPSMHLQHDMHHAALARIARAFTRSIDEL